MMSMRSLRKVFIVEGAIGAIRGIIGCAIILIILGLAGCARPTGYTKASSWTTDYGYSDKRINGDEFSIVVLGNELTSKERVGEIALLRAAHLTKQEGRTHFAIIKQKAAITESVVPISIPLLIGGALVPVPVSEKTNKEPMAILLVRLLPLGAAYPPDALDAAQIIEYLTEHFK